MNRVNIAGRALIVSALCLISLGSISCRRHDYRSARIVVPELKDARTAEIVRNAIALELTRRDMNCNIDLGKHTLQYWGVNRQFQTGAGRNLISAGMESVGYPVEKFDVRPVPSREWPNRHVAVIQAPAMTAVVDANRALAAIAWHMLDENAMSDLAGRIRTDTTNHVVTVKYDSIALSLKNLEHAVANAGFAANEVPAMLGGEDALHHGW